MPLIKIYTSSDEQDNKLAPKLEQLREFAAKELSCGDILLKPNEFSVRIIRSTLGQTIADIEIEIAAYSFRERVERQDAICLSIKKFIEEFSHPYTAYVWLQLSELGHSAGNID